MRRNQSLSAARRVSGGSAVLLELQMNPRSQTASARLDEVPSPRQEPASLNVINTCFGATDERAIQNVAGTEAVSCELGGRALNVLKLLAADMIGKCPPADWVPSTAFLRQITFERLLNARNCGPLTIEEIIRWAAARGVTIAPRSCVGKSLPEMWHELVVKFAAGELTRDQIAGALERSVRRKSTKVPVAVQRILVRLLEQPGKGPPRL